MTLHGDLCIFEALVEGLLPQGGDVVALSNVYFDESGTHEGAPFMAVAGYLFSHEQAVRFSRDWSKDLERLGLPFARMADCALGFGHYRALSMQDRIISEKLLIENIKRRSKFGFGIVLQPSRFDEILGPVKSAPSAYSFCLMLCVNKIVSWARVKNYNGRIAYFFESGHRHANEAQRYMNMIPSSGEKMMRQHFYAAHAFVDKKVAPPLQAADMLAWQLSHYHRRLMEGHQQARKDFVALMMANDRVSAITDDDLWNLRHTLETFGPALNELPPEEIHNRTELLLSALRAGKEERW